MREMYKEIINLPHHVSQKHPHMSMHDRAAQFAPFAALTGHEEKLQETMRLTEDFVVLDDAQKEEIDRKIRKAIEQIKEQPILHVEYYVPDEKKSGGSYKQFSGRLSKWREYEKELVFNEGIIIPLKDIHNVY